LTGDSRVADPARVLTEVTLREIERIFAVTDALGISREALAIPLMPRPGGGVRRAPNGRLEIVVDAADFEGFLGRLPALIEALPSDSGGPGRVLVR
jgi:hypothetical protein